MLPFCIDAFFSNKRHLLIAFFSEKEIEKIESHKRIVKTKKIIIVNLI
jgi:hypothetical protein